MSEKIGIFDKSEIYKVKITTQDDRIIVNEVMIEDKIIIEYAAEYLKPDEIFSDEQLKKWAIDNGYKEDK